MGCSLASYTPQVTPEVAAATARHFALYNQAAAAAAYAPDVDVHHDTYAHHAPAVYNHHAVPAYHGLVHGAHHGAHHYGAYTGPLASYGYVPTVGYNGYLADTPEVAAAKANFFHLYNEQAAAAAYAPDTDVYHHDNYVAAPVHHAVHHAPVHHAVGYAGAVHAGHHAFAGHHAGHAYGYVPTVTYNGFLADTPEVAAAKADHFAAHAKALAAH